MVMVPFDGRRVVHGFAGLTEGAVEGGLDAALQAATQKGYVR